MERISIACDHHGIKAKSKIIEYLSKKGYEVIDYGTNSTNAVDYPELAFDIANSIVTNETDRGILICYTGIGMSIACNRFKKVRCARVVDASDVKHSRLDNDSNVIAFSSKLPMYKIYDMLDTFLSTPFSGLERHQRRVDMLDKEFDRD